MIQNTRNISWDCFLGVVWRWWKNWTLTEGWAAYETVWLMSTYVTAHGLHSQLLDTSLVLKFRICLQRWLSQKEFLLSVWSTRLQNCLNGMGMGKIWQHACFGATRFNEQNQLWNSWQQAKTILQTPTMMAASGSFRCHFLNSHSKKMLGVFLSWSDSAHRIIHYSRKWFCSNQGATGNHQLLREQL